MSFHVHSSHSTTQRTMADLGIPASKHTVKVQAFDISLGRVPASHFLDPVLKGHEIMAAPVYCFLITHESSSSSAKPQRVMFDIGIRKDMEGFPPAVLKMFPGGQVGFDTEKDAATQLVDCGINLEDIDAVIWR